MVWYKIPNLQYWICNDLLSNHVNQQITYVNLFNLCVDKRKKNTVCIYEKTQKDLTKNFVML